MLRGILAIITGYMIFAGSAVALFALSRQDPHVTAPPRFLIFSVLYGIFFALLAGYVTALIAKVDDLRYVLLLAAIIAAGALFSLLARPGAGAIWSQVSALLLMAPAALVGGHLRLQQLRRKNS
jgi:hypothetical protein